MFLPAYLNRGNKVNQAMPEQQELLVIQETLGRTHWRFVIPFQEVLEETLEILEMPEMAALVGRVVAEEHLLFATLQHRGALLETAQDQACVQKEYEALSQDQLSLHINI
jgi:hypothetical protein